MAVMQGSCDRLPSPLRHRSHLWRSKGGWCAEGLESFGHFLGRRDRFPVALKRRKAQQLFMRELPLYDHLPTPAKSPQERSEDMSMGERQRIDPQPLHHHMSYSPQDDSKKCLCFAHPGSMPSLLEPPVSVGKVTVTLQPKGHSLQKAPTIIFVKETAAFRYLHFSQTGSKQKPPVISDIHPVVGLWFSNCFTPTHSSLVL